MYIGLFSYVRSSVFAELIIPTRVFSLDELFKNRALFIRKETYVHGKRPKYITLTGQVCIPRSRLACITEKNSEKFTRLLARRALQKQGCFHVERDVWIWKETYVYGKRPNYHAHSKSLFVIIACITCVSSLISDETERWGAGVEYHFQEIS